MHLPHDEFWFTLHAGVVFNLVAQYLDEIIVERRNTHAMQQLQIAAMSGHAIQNSHFGPPTAEIPEGW